MQLKENKRWWRSIILKYQIFLKNKFAFFEIKVILLLVDIVLIKHVLLYPTDLNSIFFKTDADKDYGNFF